MVAESRAIRVVMYLTKPTQLIESLPSLFFQVWFRNLVDTNSAKEALPEWPLE